MKRGFLFLAIFTNAKQSHAMTFKSEAEAFTSLQLIFLNEGVFEFYGFFTDYAYQMIVMPNLKKSLVGCFVIEGMHLSKARLNQ
jgi:hypothetical protein